ncbi:Peptidase A1 [Aphelenchoides avenae]|nr:Peptidase A1 [Aphelenchus avenae]
MLTALFLLFLPTVFADDTRTYPLTTYRDESYGVKVGLGTPPQALSLRLDLAVDFDASIQIEVAGTECISCCRKSRYSSASSTTSKCGQPYDGNYWLNFTNCEDTVSALGMSLKNFPFVEVSSARSSSHFVNDPWDGVFGLQSTYAHFIRRGIRKPGLYLRRTCSTGFAGDAGTITVNGLDSKNCGHAGTPLELRYENCVRTVHVTGLFTLYDNSRVFRRFESVANPPSMQVASAQVDSIEIEGGPWRAFVTLNVPEILVPQAVFDILVLRWRLEKDANDWTIDCKTIGVLKLTLRDDNDHSQMLSIDVSQVIYQVGDKCVLQVRATDDYYYDQYAYKQYWHFGVPFFRSYCTLLDFSRKF